MKFNKDDLTTMLVSQQIEHKWFMLKDVTLLNIYNKSIDSDLLSRLLMLCPGLKFSIGRTSSFFQIIICKQ